MFAEDFAQAPWAHLAAAVCMVALVLSAAPRCRGDEEGGGSFVRLVWSEDSRVRVNSPDTSEGPYKDRHEAKADGKLTITLDGDPQEYRKAWLYLELWGGHPGVADKAFDLAGATYMLPEHGAAQDNCTYSYPNVDLDLADLKEGENVFAFTCDKGTTFWGHYIIDNAAVALDVPRSHRIVGAAGLSSFRARVTATPAEGGGETLTLAVALPEGAADLVSSVEYIGQYLGHDENGDGDWSDMHGFTKARESTAIIGRSQTPPFTVDWDLEMIPDQHGSMEVVAAIRLRAPADLAYVTDYLGGLKIPARHGATVRIRRPRDLPRPFWSRSSEPRTCFIDLDVPPETIERAELHVCIWDGGSGDTPDPFTLNGYPLPVAGEGDHDLLYRVVPVDPAILKEGPNEVRLLCDTEHHGIEVCLPGPALVVRARRADTAE